MIKCLSKFKVAGVLTLAICLTAVQPILADSPNAVKTESVQAKQEKQEIADYLVKNCGAKEVDLSTLPASAKPSRELTLEEAKKLEDSLIKLKNSGVKLNCDNDNTVSFMDEQLARNNYISTPTLTSSLASSLATTYTDVAERYSHNDYFSYSDVSFRVTGYVNTYGVWWCRMYNVTPASRDIISIDPHCTLTGLSVTNGYGVYAHNCYPTYTISGDKKVATMSSHIHAHFTYVLGGTSYDYCLPQELYGSYSIDVR